MRRRIVAGAGGQQNEHDDADTDDDDDDDDDADDDDDDDEDVDDDYDDDYDEDDDEDNDDEDDEDNYEDNYEDEMEYVEVDNSQNNIQGKKKLYLENDDYPDDSEIERETNNRIIKNDFDKKIMKRSSSRKLASKRPAEQIQEPLDVEPIIDNTETSLFENQSLNSNEIDDPW